MAEKKKKKYDWKMMLPGYGAGKMIYQALKGRKRMPETRPAPKTPAPEVRKMEPETPARTAERREPTKPRKKKKPRGGVGGAMDAIQEKKRRLKEVY